MKSDFRAPKPGISLAVGQRSLGNPNLRYPLFPPLLDGCPATSNTKIQYPLAIAYDSTRVQVDFFSRLPLPGLGRWQEMLPPLATALSMGEGGTPLVAMAGLNNWLGCEGDLYIKDESRNPTGSHKDRLNLCTVSAAVFSEAPGVTVASSGNHGAAAAAYASRAGLPCVLFITEATDGHILRMVMAYGAAVVPLPRPMRRPIMRELVEKAGFHPVSNITETHTGHPFGPEGYKTIAFEIFQQLGGRVPAAVFVPTAYAELLYGIWLGFRELRDIGRAGSAPHLYACEPAAGAPLREALRKNIPVALVEEKPTAAYSIVVAANSYRGVLAIQESEGEALALSDEEMLSAQAALARQGLWAELSGAAGLAGFKQAVDMDMRFDGPVVCLMTSTGFKDQGSTPPKLPAVPPTFEGVRQMLRDIYHLSV
jgi:threonine synthase